MILNPLKEILTKCWTLTVFSLILLCDGPIQAQSEQRQDLRPVRNTFESIWLIDNHTVMVPFSGTLEWDIQHRFGTMKNGYDDYFGLAAPSNIRLGFSYVPMDNLLIGFGITKERKVWDFNAKYALLKQKQGGGFPLSISYFVTAGLDSRDNDDFLETSDRFSYFHQLMFARKFSDRFSLQIAPSISWYNFSEPVYNIEGGLEGRMNNNHIAITGLGKIGLTDVTSFIFNVDIPITEHEFNQPGSNIAFGFEFTTSSHAFQIFIGNYQSLTPQYNHLLNQNKFGDGEILLGFNLTRLWNF